MSREAPAQRTLTGRRARTAWRTPVWTALLPRGLQAGAGRAGAGLAPNPPCAPRAAWATALGRPPPESCFLVGRHLRSEDPSRAWRGTPWAPCLVQPGLWNGHFHTSAPVQSRAWPSPPLGWATSLPDAGDKSRREAAGFGAEAKGKGTWSGTGGLPKGQRAGGLLSTAEAVPVCPASLEPGEGT